MNLFKRKPKQRDCKTCCFAEIQTECNYHPEEKLIYFYELYECSYDWNDMAGFTKAMTHIKKGECPQYKRKRK